jgi:ATP-dependent Clp protease adaptor protein ClpS
VGDGLLFVGMFVAFALPGAIGAATLLARFMARQKELNAMAVAAFLEATARGHTHGTATHVALVMLDVPEIAEHLRGRVDRDAVRDRIDDALGRKETPLEGTVQDDGSVTKLFRWAHVRQRYRGTRPLDVLFTFYEIDLFAEARGVLERAGLTQAVVLAAPATPSDPVVAGGVTLPYREPPLTSSASLRFWNDNKTTQEFVIDVLVSELGKAPSTARMLMTLVHFEGSAVVAGLARAEADSLAERITTRARSAGYPLRVTVE